MVRTFRFCGTLVVEDCSIRTAKGTQSAKAIQHENKTHLSSARRGLFPDGGRETSFRAPLLGQDYRQREDQGRGA